MVNHENTVCLRRDRRTHQPGDCQDVYKRQVPDVLGRSVSDANQLITNAGFNINIVGSVPEGAEEVVVTQDPPPGSSAETGSIITVNIDPEAEQQQQQQEGQATGQ